jgi:signal peptidase I
MTDDPPEEETAADRAAGESKKSTADSGVAVVPSTWVVRRRSPLAGVLSFFRELPGLLLLAFVLALLIKSFAMQAFYIPSGSMEHTLDIGDRVLVNKIVYHLHDPRRGDIIVFSDPHPVAQPHRNPFSAFLHWLTDGLGLSRDPNKDFIKRVIGLPGDVVEMQRGVTFVNGKRIPESYLGPAVSQGDFNPHTVPLDHYFVMGDNRGDSNDSRGTLGDIPRSKVIGRAFVIIWPPSRIGLLRRPHYPATPAPGVVLLLAAIGRRRAA